MKSFKAIYETNLIFIHRIVLIKTCKNKIYSLLKILIFLKKIKILEVDFCVVWVGIKLFILTK